MNRGVLQSSPVQQMMAGNPNWWSINTMRPPTHHHLHHHHHQQQQQQASNSPSSMPPHHQYPSFFPHHQYTPTSSSSSSSSSSLPIPSWHDNQEQQLPESWSQLLLGGLVGEEDKYQVHHQQQAKKLENVWEEQALHQAAASVVDVKQENSASSYVFGHANSSHEDHFHQTATKPAAAAAAAWSSHQHQHQHQHQILAASSPKSSCVSTTFSSNLLDFAGNQLKAAAAADQSRNPQPDRSSECNSSTTTGGALKKARVQPSATQSTFKVRKEKLGDRITALHQLVSPFGKTDTASVLLEAIGYIRFLQSQIEALSLPYLGSGSGNMRQQQSAVQGERNSIFPEDPGQLLNDNCMKRKGGPDQQDCHEDQPKKDLRSRGLCLVPVSCTLTVGSDNGADNWAPAALGGSFR